MRAVQAFLIPMTHDPHSNPFSPEGHIGIMSDIGGTKYRSITVMKLCMFVVYCQY